MDALLIVLNGIEIFPTLYSAAKISKLLIVLNGIEILSINFPYMVCHSF